MVFSYYTEKVFPFWPENDTFFPPSFSKANFEQVESGMSSEKVQELLGPPLAKYNCISGWEPLVNSQSFITCPDNQEILVYSRDGGEYAVWDFAWHMYGVRMVNDVVVEASAKWAND